MKYLREFITTPATVGSIMPSSRALAEAMVRDAGLQSASVVLEYGPATGVFTEYILRELSPRAQFAAIELNRRFAQAFRRRYPRVRLFEDSVANVAEICRQAGMPAVDSIVSGIPWAIFPERLQVQCLEEMMNVLKPGSRFVTFTYVHSQPMFAGAKRFAALLPGYFSSVSRSPVVWRNVPPAFIYRCTR